MFHRLIALLLTALSSSGKRPTVRVRLIIEQLLDRMVPDAYV